MSIEGNHRTVIGIAALVWGMAAVAQAPFAVDTTFRAYPSTWYVSDVLPQEDGKVIISGQIRYPGSPIPTAFAGLARLNADGSWDDSFPWSSLGQGKMVPWEDRFYIASPGIVRRVFYTGANDLSFTMANALGLFTPLQGGDYHVFPDGRLVMSGLHTLSDTARGFVGYHNFIWFSNTGHLDTTRTHRKGNGELSTFKQLPDGKYIASGTCTVYDGRPTSWIQRMHPDGSLDTTFFSGVNWGTAYAYLPLEDGRVYAGGVFRKADAPQDTLRLVRLMPDGSLDATFNEPQFGTGGLPNLNFGAVISSIESWPDGYLLVTGAFRSVNGIPHASLCLLDSTGAVVPVLAGHGVGPYTYQNYTYASIRGIKPYDEQQYLIWGGYHGYTDGVINDPAQRFVTRLHGGDLNLSAPASSAPPLQPLLHIHPNPATLSGAEAWVAFDYDLLVPPKDASIVVRDLMGRTVYKQDLREQQHQLVWDTRQTAPGTYTATLYSGGRALRTEKLILQP